MKNKYGIWILLIATLFVACKSVRKEQGDSFESMDEFFDAHKQEEQTFVLDSGGTGPIVGKMGSLLYGDSSIFMDANSNDVSYPITLKLIELYTRGDIILYRTPTISDNGTVLRSGGEIKLTAFKDSQPLQIKPGKYFRVDMPCSAPETGMTMFYSSQDPAENWTYSADPALDVVGFYQTRPTKLGWINCDKLYSGGTNTTITFTVDGSGTENINVFIAFKNFLSVLKVSGLVSTNVPEGEDITVIAMAKDKGGNYRLHQSNETIAAGMTVALDMQEVTEQQLVDFLGGL
ncbi:MAG: hypothetical protein H6585_13095 [Flavobacteriales bacterium]|nr:hypothetical protein [Flavobacteriales bacterium]MCB9449269.1 hypothetical protein [Flavobacteriales bacterium]